MRWIRAYSKTWRTYLTMSTELNNWEEIKKMIEKYNKSERQAKRICDWVLYE